MHLYISALVLLTVGILSHAKNANREKRQMGNPGVQDEDCEECSALIQKLLEDTGDDLVAEELPKEMKMPDAPPGAPGIPCSKCVLVELKGIRRGGDICAKKQGDAVNQDMRLQVAFTKAVCDCVVKKDDGSEAPVQLTIEWKEGRARLNLNIADDKAQVNSGTVDCDSPPPSGKCMVDMSTASLTCDCEDDVKGKCEDMGKDSAPVILQNVMESMFPPMATAKFNENPEAIRKLKCDPDKK